MIVDGQSTTDDSQDCVGITVVEQLVRTVSTLRANQAMLQAEVQKLKARQSSVTVDNRKLLFIKLCILLYGLVMLT